MEYRALHAQLVSFTCLPHSHLDVKRHRDRVFIREPKAVEKPSEHTEYGVYLNAR